jgi:hypothetical protein
MTGDIYKMDSIKTQVETGQYRVDPHAIADAIIGWFATRPRKPGRGLDAQNECSKPDRGSSASVNSTPGGPSTTDPIQAKPLFDGGSL